MTENEEKAFDIAADRLIENGALNFYCDDNRLHAALQMAQWKDEQYLENAEDDAKSYVDGVAKANPDLDEWVLNFMETAYIAGRNRIR